MIEKDSISDSVIEFILFSHSLELDIKKSLKNNLNHQDFTTTTTAAAAAATTTTTTTTTTTAAAAAAAAAITTTIALLVLPLPLSLPLPSPLPLLSLLLLLLLLLLLVIFSLYFQRRWIKNKKTLIRSKVFFFCTKIILYWLYLL